MKNNIYCVHCGKKNEVLKQNKNCMLCKKNLYEKSHELRDYLYDKVKDEVKGNIEENVINFITALIKKYLYGITVTASVVFAATSITVNAINKPETELTNIAPQFVKASNEERILGCYKSELEDNYYVFDRNESLKSYQLDHPGTQLKYRFNEEEYYGYQALQDKPLRLDIMDVTEQAGSSVPFWWNSNDSFLYGDTVYNRVDCNELTIDWHI